MCDLFIRDRPALEEMRGLDVAGALSEQIGSLDRAIADMDAARADELLRVGREMSREQVVEYAAAEG